MRYSSAVLQCLVSLSLLLVPAAAMPKSKKASWRAPLDCPLDQNGWVSQDFEGKTRNRLTCRGGALNIASKGSISLHAIAPPSEFAKAKTRTWDWRVGKSVGVSDLTRKGSDDRSLAVLVAFRFDPATASFAERLLRPLVEARQGEAAPGRVLAYTWVEAGGRSPSGMMKSPFGGDAHRIVPLARPLGRWRREKIDLSADYRKAFGPGPFAVQYVAIAADTDDLGGRAEAMIRELSLAR